MSEENKFVNDLWNKDPELVKRVLRKIFKLKETYSLEYDYTDDGKLVFEVRYDDVRASYIFVRDFMVCWWGDTGFANSPESIKWMNIMARLYGKAYVQKFVKTRDEEIMQYTDEFNDITNSIEAELNKVVENKNNKIDTQTTTL